MSYTSYRKSGDSAERCSAWYEIHIETLMSCNAMFAASMTFQKLEKCK